MTHKQTEEPDVILTMQKPTRFRYRVSNVVEGLYIVYDDWEQKEIYRAMTWDAVEGFLAATRQLTTTNGGAERHVD